jgi:hypothetical protein
MKTQLYTFCSIWELPASKRAVWQTLTTQPFSWQDWWPELSDVHDMNLANGLSGTTFSCTWQAPVGYRLKSVVTLGKVIDLKQVTLHSDGDIEGTVVCRLKEKTAGQTNVKIDWQVMTTKAWMNYLAPLLKPLFIYNHHAVMRSGERGLRNYLGVKAS